MSDTDTDEDEALDDAFYVRLFGEWPELERLHVDYQRWFYKPLPDDLTQYRNWAIIDMASDTFKGRAFLQSALDLFEFYARGHNAEDMFAVLFRTADKSTLRVMDRGPYNPEGPWPRYLIFNPDHEQARDAALQIQAYYQEGESPDFNPHEDDYYHEELYAEVEAAWKSMTVAERLELLSQYDCHAVLAFSEEVPSDDDANDAIMALREDVEMNDGY